MPSYDLDLFITLPLSAFPDRVRTFAGTLTVTPTGTHLTWVEDDTEHTRHFPNDATDHTVFGWVFAYLTASNPCAA